MRKIGLIVMGILILLSPMSLQAQQQDRWNIQFKVLPSLGIVGNDLMGWKYYAQAQFFESKKDQTPPDSTIFNYSVVYEPIVTYMPDILSYIWDISYRKNLWKTGLIVWSYNGSGQDRDIVTTPPSIENEDGSKTSFINGVSLIGKYTLVPVLNMNQESRFSPVPYRVYNSLKLQTYRAYISYTLLEKFDIRFGLKAVNVWNEQKKQQSYKTYIQGSPLADFHNYITLAQTASAQYSITGPSTGFTFSTTSKGPVHFEASIDGALLSTGKKEKISYSAEWTDIDSVVIISPQTGEIKEIMLFDGSFPFSLNRTIAIPNIEIDLQASIDIYHTQNSTTRLGIGFFKSIFFNAPIAPVYEISDMWSWRGSSRWVLQKKNLEFYALSIIITVLF